MKSTGSNSSDVPLVSVAMPVYNAEKYVRQAIDSVLNQTYSHFELIIVNDGSSDRSREIVLSYQDARIRYFENEKNLGIVKTRNKCIHHATGRYIAVLDNDDVAMPERLAKQVGFLEANPDYCMCGSFYEVIDGAGHIVNRMKLPTSAIQVKTYLLFDNCFCNSSVIIRSGFLKERSYTEGIDMVEDYHLFYELSKYGKLANLPLFITQYRVHGRNISIEKLADMRNLRAGIDKTILDDLGISYSAEELMVHTNFATGNFHYFKTNKQIAELEAWLLKLFRELKARGQYDMQLVKRTLIRRWILLFSHTNNISYKMFFNRLCWKFHIEFAGFFLGLLAEKYSKVRSIS